MAYTVTPLAILFLHGQCHRRELEHDTQYYCCFTLSTLLLFWWLR